MSTLRGMGPRITPRGALMSAALCALGVGVWWLVPRSVRTLPAWPQQIGRASISRGILRYAGYERGGRLIFTRVTLSNGLTASTPCKLYEPVAEAAGESYFALSGGEIHRFDSAGGRPQNLGRCASKLSWPLCAESETAAWLVPVGEPIHDEPVLFDVCVLPSGAPKPIVASSRPEPYLLGFLDGKLYWQERIPGEPGQRIRVSPFGLLKTAEGRVAQTLADLRGRAIGPFMVITRYRRNLMTMDPHTGAVRRIRTLDRDEAFHLDPHWTRTATEERYETPVDGRVLFSWPPELCEPDGPPLRQGGAFYFVGHRPGKVNRQEIFAVRPGANPFSVQTVGQQCELVAVGDGYVVWREEYRDESFFDLSGRASQIRFRLKVGRMPAPNR